MNPHRSKPKRKRPTRPAAKKAPIYEADDGPLTARQIAVIKKCEPPGRFQVQASLFRDTTRTAATVSVKIES